MNGLVQHKLHKYFHETPVLQKMQSRYINKLAYDSWYYGLSYSNKNYNQGAKVFYGTVNNFVGKHAHELHYFIKNKSNYFKTNKCFKDMFERYLYRDLVNSTEKEPVSFNNMIAGPCFYCDKDLIIRKIDLPSKRSKNKSKKCFRVDNVVAIINDNLFVISKKNNCILTPVIFYLTNSVNPSVATFRTFITQKELSEKYNLDVYKLKSLSYTESVTIQEALKDPELVELYNL